MNQFTRVAVLGVLIGALVGVFYSVASRLDDDYEEGKDEETSGD